MVKGVKLVIMDMTGDPGVPAFVWVNKVFPVKDDTNLDELSEQIYQETKDTLASHNMAEEQSIEIVISHEE